MPKKEVVEIHPDFLFGIARVVYKQRLEDGGSSKERVEKIHPGKLDRDSQIYRPAIRLAIIELARRGLLDLDKCVPLESDRFVPFPTQEESEAYGKPKVRVRERRKENVENFSDDRASALAV